MYSKAVTEKHRGGSLVATAGTRWHYVALSVVLSTCSMLSKEQGITSLGVCAGFDVLLHWEAVWSTLLKKDVAASSEATKQGNGKASQRRYQHRHSAEETPENSQCMWLVARRLGMRIANKQYTVCYTTHFKKIIIMSLCLCIGVLISAGLCLLSLRIWINHGTDPIFKPEELRAAFHPDRIVRYSPTFPL